MSNGVDSERSFYTSVGKIAVPVITATIGVLIAFIWNHGIDISHLQESQKSQDYRLDRLDHGDGPTPAASQMKIDEINRRITSLESERMRAIEENIREIRDYEQRILDHMEKKPLGMLTPTSTVTGKEPS